MNMNMYRAEDKYILSSTKMRELEERISMIMISDTNAEGSGYSISSLYFDTISDKCLRDTIDGNPYRDKYRIRIYNNSTSVIKLEVKRKKYNRAIKISSNITKEEMWSLIEGDEIDDACVDGMISARSLFNYGIVSAGLRPKVIVSYERNAYICDSGNVRVTFDRNIRGSNQTELFGSNKLVYDYPLSDNGVGSVLEVKYDEFLPGYIAQALETNDMIQTSNSKYGMCRMLYE